ncbi:MAG: HAD family phosphatase [SAR324 cluster bacterium]|nr:HAD family phosphatase [SAR324 cluster bacterium]
MKSEAAWQVHGIDPRRVRAVVFDLGGVFLKGTVDNVIRFGESVGMTSEAWRVIRHELFIDGGAWDEVERGEMTLDTFAEILSGFLARQGIQIDMERARNFMGNPADSIMMRLRPEIVEACLTVRRVMPTALLTNNIAEWREQWRTRLDIPALFNQVIDSSEVGLRKPEPGIYKLMEAALNMPGEDLLFIDDLGVNLKGARNLGWQTLKYDETAKVLEVLSTVTSAAQG